MTEKEFRDAISLISKALQDRLLVNRWGSPIYQISINKSYACAIRMNEDGDLHEDENLSDVKILTLETVIEKDLVEAIKSYEAAKSGSDQVMKREKEAKEAMERIEARLRAVKLEKV